MDYQNVHLVGAGCFEPNIPPHECLVHPLHFAHQVVTRRNERQRPGYRHAHLDRVFVYRGLPSADHDPKPYARNLAQKAEWELDPRVQTTLRPLKYIYDKAADGTRATDARGRPIIKERREKGVDVLCALALIREALDPGIDLVILASQDSDLEPALDEVLRLGTAKVETCSWFNPKYRSSHEIRPASQRVWNTRLDARSFAACRDTTQY